MKSKVYAVVDIETTGGMPARDRITEIAIVKYDGEQIISKFQTLINPQRSIPYEITRITGITNDMVADAPKFYEVAKQIVELTEDAIFVAHNVRFDYGFIREEFKVLGYTYSRKLLCTVQLTRKAFPGLKSYSLGNLIRHFGIQVNNRHRAMDDTLATVDVLGRILKLDDAEYKINHLLNAGIKEVNLPNSITMERLHSLPESAGVYYFHNTYNNVIYVGKSINIQKRVMQHFSKMDAKAEKLSAKAFDLSFEETGNELIALLLESREIKAMQPEINRAQRTKEYPYFIYTFQDEAGFINFSYDRSGKKVEKGKDIINFYGTKQGAKSHLYSMATILNLCSGKSGLTECSNDCFYFHTGECKGAGIDKESVEEYNLRAELGKEYIKRTFDDNFFLILEGRSNDEKALVLIENGHYLGYGYILVDELNHPVEDWKECIDYITPNPEYNRIVRTYMERNPNLIRRAI